MKMTVAQANKAAGNISSKLSEKTPTFLGKKMKGATKQAPGKNVSKKFAKFGD